MKDINRGVIFSKVGEAALVIASDLLSYQIGDKIKTVDEYLKETKFSRGTLYNALQMISDKKLATFEKRGQLGTFIVKINYSNIWKFLNISNINIVMPLPYSKHYEGLATGFSYVFNDLKIPLSILFLRGSNKRLLALNNNVADIIVISYWTAQCLIKAKKNVEIIHILKDNSYLNDQILLVTNKNNNIDLFAKESIKLIIDKDSLNTKFLAQAIFLHQKLTFIPCSYNQIADKLITDDIDGIFWTKNEIKDNFNLSVYDITTQLKNTSYFKDSLQACLVTNKNNLAVKNLIKNKINFLTVDEILENVVNGTEKPFY